VSVRCVIHTPVEIARLNDVHVCHDELAAIAASKSNHRKILEELAANGTRTHDEERRGAQLGLTATRATKKEKKRV
jgi:hypothetical protein